MRPVSEAYRKAIQLHRTQGIRNKMHVEVSFGLFAEGAKEDSTYLVSPGAPFSDDGNMYNESVAISTSYAMWEKDSLRLDGAQRLLPSAGGYLAQGYVSAAVASEDGAFTVPPAVTVSFGQHYSAVGLSLLFDVLAELNAQEVRVTTYDGDTVLKVATAENAQNEVDFKPELGLDNFDRLLIEFTRAKPFQRVRLNRILFGIGYVYGNEDIYSIEHTRSGHPLSLSLPDYLLKFTLYNYEGRYDEDLNSPIVRFLQKQQEAILRYGYDVSGNGDIEWFNGGIFYLESWGTQGYKASFNCRDIFWKLSQSTYRKGRADVGYTTRLSLLAQEVFEDAGITNYYASDKYLTNTIVNAPLPYDSHANCLQLIANAGNCTLDQDTYGAINLRQRNLAKKSDWFISAQPTLNGEEPKQLPYSNIYSVVQTESSVEYALWEQDYFRLDESINLLPDDQDYYGAGYNMDLFPLSSGHYLYAYNPETNYGYYSGMWVNLQQDATFGTIRIKLSESARTTQIRIRGFTYNNPNWVELYAKNYAVIGSDIVINDNFDKTQGVYIYVLNNSKRQRLRVLSVDIRLESGLTVTKDDVLGMPTSKLYPPCKNLSVNYRPVRTWTPFSDYQVTIEPNALTEIKYDSPRRVGVNIPNVNTVVDVLEMYANCMFIQLSGVSGQQTITLSGQIIELKIAATNNTLLNESGEDAAIDNVLVFTEPQAQAIVERSTEYYGGRNGQEIETLGYPECDENDLIVYDGKTYTVLENTITFNQGNMRGKMKLRGGAYGVDDTED